MTEPYLYMLIKAVVTLILVLGLMGAALYALRYFAGTGGGSRKAGRSPVRVISTTFLGNKRNLAVVDVAGELIVVGMTPTSINFITRVESPEAAEEIRRSGGGGGRQIFNLFQQ